MWTRKISLAAALTLFALVMAYPADSAYALGSLAQDTNSDWVISDAELAAAETSWTTGGISNALMLQLEDFHAAGGYHWDAGLSKYVAGASGTPAYPILPSAYGWSTYVGGNSYEHVWGVAYDAQDNAYAVGGTRSTDFPVKDAIQPAISGSICAFVTKIKPSGELEWSTYLGGTTSSNAYAVAVDGNGNVIVYGFAGSGFPLVNAFQTAVGSFFIAKLSPSGAIIWSSFFGSIGTNDVMWPDALALNSSGDAFIMGQTDANNMPVLNAFQPTCGGNGDYFIAKVSSGGQLVFASYLGGSGAETWSPWGKELAVNAQGNAFVTGYTSSTDFPTAHGFRTTPGGTPDVFVAEVSPTGNLVYSTYLGGSGYEEDNSWVGPLPVSIAADDIGEVFLTGYTTSGSFPVVNAYQSTLHGVSDAIVAKISPPGTGVPRRLYAQLSWCTYFGGSDYENIEGLPAITCDGAGNAFVTGNTHSTNFPILHAFQATMLGYYDGYVAKFAPSGELLWSSYIGGSGNDDGRLIAVDAHGNVDLVGYSTSADVATQHSFNTQYRGSGEVMAARITGDGVLGWIGLLGGSALDAAHCMAIDSSDSILIGGYTRSADFPTVNGFDTTYGGGPTTPRNYNFDGFATRIVAVPQVTVNRTLAAAVVPGMTTHVILDVGVNGAVVPSAVIIDEIVPAGWTLAGAIPEPASFNSATGKATWLLAGAAVVNCSIQYELQVPGGETVGAVRQFAGDGAYDIAGSLIVGGTTGNAQIPVMALVARPVISPNGGIACGTATAHITCATPGATIRYTTDESTVTPSSAVYSGSVVMSNPTTLRAAAYRDGMVTSDQAVAVFTVTAAADTDCNWLVDDDELGAAVAAYAAGTMSAQTLLTAEDYHAANGYYWDDTLHMYVPGPAGPSFPTTAAPPVLAWSDYVGGNNVDTVWQCAADSAGNLYAVGYTHSTDFTLPGAVDLTSGRTIQGFIMKVAPTGELEWAAYMPASVYSVAVDSTGNAIIPAGGGLMKFSPTGEVLWTTAVPVDSAVRGLAVDSTGDAILAGDWIEADYHVGVAEVSPSGALLWADEIAGNGTEYAWMDCLALDASGNIFVAGQTTSTDLATPNAFDTTLGGEQDDFVTKIGPSGNIQWTTYLGGSSTEWFSQDYVGTSYPYPACDAAGNVIVVGSTQSADFPTLNAFDDTLTGSQDIFVTKFTPSGALAWSTYVGGDEWFGYDYEYVNGRPLVDAEGAVVITGETSSSDFPVLNGFSMVYPAEANETGFITKITSDGQLDWSSYMYGAEGWGYCLAVGPHGTILAAGRTYTGGLATPGAFDTALGGMDALVASISPSGQILWASYLGGSSFDQPRYATSDSAGNFYVAGYTSSTNFPTVNAFDSTYGGGGRDAYLCKISGAAQITLTRTLPALVPSGGTAPVTLALESTDNIVPNAVIITETIPAGWDVSDASPSYTAFDQPTGVIKWVLSGAEVTNRTLSYSAHVPADAQNGMTALFSGTCAYTNPLEDVVTVGTQGSSSFVVQGVVAGDTNSDWVISDSELAAANVSWLGGTLSDAALLDLIAFHNAGGYHFDLLGGDYMPGPAGAPSPTTATPPELTWSDYVGGSGRDYVRQCAVDSTGSLYAVGRATSTDFTLPGAVDLTSGGTKGGFIMKVARTGELEWAAYMPAPVNSVAVDSAGNAIIPAGGGLMKFSPTGQVLWTTAMPLYGDLRTLAVDSTGDAILAGDWIEADYHVGVGEVSPSGTLLWADRIAGNGSDYASVDCLAVDASGNIFVTGSTTSTNLATPNAFDTTLGGEQDDFVAKIGPSGNVEWTTYLGGSSTDWFTADYAGSYPYPACDGAGNVIVVGSTQSADFPTLNAFDGTLKGATDLFAAKFTPSGTLAWSTYLGGDEWFGYDYENVYCKPVIDAAGGIVITGETSSSNFPVKDGFSMVYPAGANGTGFITKLKPDGALDWSSYMYGANGSGYCLAAGPHGTILAAGWASVDGLATPGAFDMVCGSEDTLVASISPSGQILWASYLGGSLIDYPRCATSDSTGNFYVAGQTNSTDFPTTNAFDSTFGGSYDAYVCKISASGQVALTRTVPQYAVQGGAVPVSLAVDIVEAFTPDALIVHEMVPMGWTVTNAAPAYSSFDSSTGLVTWLLAGPQVADQTIAYTAHVPGGAPLASVNITGSGVYNNTWGRPVTVGPADSTVTVQRAITITTGSLPGGEVGRAYSQALAATGGTGALTWSRDAGSLPVGLSLNASTGAISGTPTATGTYSFTAKATDTVGASDTKALSIVVNAVLSITTSSLSNGKVGASYSKSLAATGGVPPYTWSTTAGSLPPGLALSAGGAISGTPTTYGTWTFTASVGDSVGSSATKALSLKVDPPTLTIATTTIPGGQIGLVYSQALMATGGVPAYTWSTSAGTLPAGLSLDAAAGVISGTPAVSGTSAFTARVTDSLGKTATRSLSMVIVPVGVTVTAPNGGEIWAKGTSHSITWTTGAGGNVKIELYKAGAYLSTLSSSTANDGLYSWTVPSTLAATSDYKVKISLTAAPTVYDLSDGPFTVPPYIATTAPASGAIWHRGTTQAITWTSNAGGNVKIDLYKGAVLDSTITASTANNGSYPWPIPPAQSMSPSYKITITWLGDGVTAGSSGTFNITGAGTYVTVTSPNGGEYWQRGSAHSITWNSDCEDNVKIELYKAGKSVSTLVSSTANTGSWPWTISSTQTIGSDYQVKVTCASNNTLNDLSNTNFTIDVRAVTISALSMAPTTALPGQPVTVNSDSGTYSAGVPTETDRILIGIRDSSGHWMGGDPQVVYTATPGDLLSHAWTGSMPTISAPVKTGTYYFWAMNSGSADNAAAIAAFKAAVPSSTTPSHAKWAAVLTVAGAALTVTSPNGGETWASQSTRTITWTSYIGGHVKIDLYKGTSLLAPIVANTPNDGAYSGQIPLITTTVTNLKVRIGSIETTSIYDYSDNYFTVTPPGLLEPLSLSAPMLESASPPTPDTSGLTTMIVAANSSSAGAAGALVDGDADTVWQTLGTTIPEREYVTCDAGAKTTLCAVELAPGNRLDLFPSEFLIEVSADGLRWEPVIYAKDFAAAGASLWRFESTNARYVRISGLGVRDAADGRYYWQLGEVMVYSSTAK